MDLTVFQWAGGICSLLFVWMAYRYDPVEWVGAKLRKKKHYTRTDY